MSENQPIETSDQTSNACPGASCEALSLTKKLRTTETADLEQRGIALLVAGIPGFSPSAGMINCAYHYIYENDDNKKPTDILTRIGLVKQNWYDWKENPLFLKWWESVQLETIRLQIPSLYRSLLKRGEISDTAAAKIVIQRFDKEFKERSEADNSHTFPVYSPEEQDYLKEIAGRYKRKIAAGPQEGADNAV